MNNKDILFINIIKYSGPDFKCREELFNLHKKNLQLEASINIRKNIEYEYNKLKIEELNEKIDELKFQKSFIIKRNKKILEDIQKNNFYSMELASHSYQYLDSLNKNKKKYQNYLDSIQPRIQSEFNTQLFSQNNIFMLERNKELNELKKIENKNNYYEELMKINEKLAKEINDLKKRNHLLSLENQEKEKLFLEKNENLKNKINIINQDNNQNNEMNRKDRVNISNKEEIIHFKNIKKDIIQKKSNDKIIQFELNKNHSFGELDKLKQAEIDILNEKIKKMYLLNKENAKDDSMSLDNDSLDDLRKQILPKKKEENYKFNMVGTLNQNFENSINDKNNENKNVSNIQKNENSQNSNGDNKKNAIIDHNNDDTPEGQNNSNKVNQMNKIGSKSSFNLLNSKNNNIDNNKIEEKSEDKKEDIIEEEKKGEEKQQSDGSGENSEYKDYDIEIIESVNSKK